ncbi:MAG: SEC-C metal-binding domain-containing protein [Pirellulaceae bacterium]
MSCHGIIDTIEELQHWVTFAEKPAPQRAPLPAPPFLAAAPKTAEPVVAPVLARGARIGRNDPCTCGSGKKFKKCCGARK